jgi:ubiquinone/menaquinone biosynthesis C-methylase UbiE
MNTQQQWQFVGSVPENYERYLVPSIFGPWASDLVEVAGPQQGERVVDIACGTGIVARTAAQRVGSDGRVVGLDLSVPMLEAARAASAAQGALIEWREGSAVKLPLADAAFDVVFCQQGLQFFPDRPTALREMHRVLKPGGRLALSVWRRIEHSPGFAVLAEALTHHINPEAGALMTSGPFGLSNPNQLRALVAGITIRPAEKVLRYPSPDAFVLRYVAGSALAGPVAGADDRARAALLADVNARLQRYVDDDGLAFPIESNVVVARR